MSSHLLHTGKLMYPCNRPRDECQVQAGLSRALLKLGDGVSSSPPTSPDMPPSQRADSPPCIPMVPSMASMSIAQELAKSGSKFTATAKLFVSEQTVGEEVCNAVEAVKTQLKRESIDVLVVVWPCEGSGPCPEKDAVPANLNSIWEAVQCMKQRGLVSVLAVSGIGASAYSKLVEMGPVPDELHGDIKCPPQEFYVPLLKNCYANSTELRVSDDTCIKAIAPADMVDRLFAKFTPRSPTSIIQPGSPRTGSIHWRPDWAVRYTVVDTSRQVIRDRGYIVKCDSY